MLRPSFRFISKGPKYLSYINVSVPKRLNISHFLFNMFYLPILAYSPVKPCKLWAKQAQREVVKITNLDFSYWAWITPWGHILSLKNFRQILVMSWAIRPANLIQILDIWWSSLDIMDDFRVIFRMAFFCFSEINKSLFWVLSIYFLFIFSLLLHSKLQ